MIVQNVVSSNDMTMKQQSNMISFTEKFGTEEQCLAFLSKEKWGSGYSCRKCNHTVSVKGRTWHHRRCQKCGYDESCTAHTLFHKLKFPLVSAFSIVYHISTMKKGMSSVEISRQYGIHQENAWYFKRKVQAAMQSQGTTKLSGIVQVDETIIGGFEPGSVGRSKGKRRSVQIAVEIEPIDEGAGGTTMKNAYAVIIEDYSSQELSNGIEKMIDKEAALITDAWTAYPIAVGSRFHIKMLSDRGNSMPEIHRLIFNLKNWIRGTHHKVSGAHLQSYLDEYFYKFNRRNCLETMPKAILKAMIKHPWMPYKLAVAA
jgi:hypothetical protein